MAIFDFVLRCATTAFQIFMGVHIVLDVQKQRALRSVLIVTDSQSNEYNVVIK